MLYFSVLNQYLKTIFMLMEYLCRHNLDLTTFLSDIKRCWFIRVFIQLYKLIIIYPHYHFRFSCGEYIFKIEVICRISIHPLFFLSASSNNKRLRRVVFIYLYLFINWNVEFSHGHQVSSNVLSTTVQPLVYIN